MALVPCRECEQQISSQAKICPHCGIQYPVSKMSNGGRIGCLAVIAIIVLVSIIGSNSASPPSPTSSFPTAPHDVSNSDNTNVVQVKRNGDDLFVTLNMPQNITLNMQTEQLAEDIFQLAKEQTQNGKPFDQLNFIAQDQVVDAYGNQSIAPVFQVEFISDSLKKVNWDNLDDVGLLNLEWNVYVLSRAGQQLLQAYCNNHQSNAEAFCEAALINVGERAN